MIRILHTSDLHIGQRFFDYDRTEEHKYFFDWLINIIKLNNIDVLLISGDIFDTPNPSSDFGRAHV